MIKNGRSERTHIETHTGNDHVMIQFNGNMMTDMTKGSIRRKSFVLLKYDDFII